MIKNTFRKGLALVIAILSIGLIITPVISGQSIEISEFKLNNFPREIRLIS